MPRQNLNRRPVGGSMRGVHFNGVWTGASLLNTYFHKYWLSSDQHCMLNLETRFRCREVSAQVPKACPFNEEWTCGVSAGIQPVAIWNGFLFESEDFWCFNCCRYIIWCFIILVSGHSPWRQWTSLWPSGFFSLTMSHELHLMTPILVSFLLWEGQVN